MQPLSGLDSAFLTLETPTSHLHVTGVLAFDPATTSSSRAPSLAPISGSSPQGSQSR